MKIRQSDWKYVTELLSANARPGEPFNITASIPCWNPSCKVHYTLWGYNIGDDGNVKPDPSCPRCKTRYDDVTLEGWNPKPRYDYNGFIAADRDLP